MPGERESEAEEGVPLIPHESDDGARDQPPETLEVDDGGQREVQHSREELGERGAARWYWKDDIFDCFQYGVCHPSFCMAFSTTFCLGCMMGQVMMRLRLNWLGNPASRGRRAVKPVGASSISLQPVSSSRRLPDTKDKLPWPFLSS